MKRVTPALPLGRGNAIELLAPAKNLECGIAAIDHGADAVYIGARSFGARHAAGNSIDDIRTLCEYAHQFGVKVYATVNTIIYNEEMDEALALVKDLQVSGIDAILIQDMGLLSMMNKDSGALSEEIRSEAYKAPSLEGGPGWVSLVGSLLHASTQTDNRTVEKVKWLRSLGFSRVVLARELTADEIAEIHHQVPDVELEVFVHGALCVSYSGQCYASEHCFGRSANRGECAQLCRMRYTLEDADGNTINPFGENHAGKTYKDPLPRGRAGEGLGGGLGQGLGLYYLSLKDQCQIDNLGKIIDAGAVSLKIEGRLKDVAYVKNVVAAYSEALNRLGVRRSSWGRVALSFEPDLKRSFNRGYTDYFLNGRHEGIASFMTPKAIGEYVGKVKRSVVPSMSRRPGDGSKAPSILVSGVAPFVNGDGLCYLDADGELKGFRVNRAEGNRLFPLQMPRDLQPGTALYRSQDFAFDQLMAGKTAVRSIPLRLHLADCGDELLLQMTAVDAPLYGEARVSIERQEAQKAQMENMRRQLTKLGGTIFTADTVNIDASLDKAFVPSSVLAELRRNAVENIRMEEDAEHDDCRKCSDKPVPLTVDRYHEMYGYLHNIANDAARTFYEQQGIADAELAYELQEKISLHGRNNEKLLMQCRHCIRYSLGYCVKNGGKRPQWKEPLSLRLADGRRFRLEFDCRNCQMNVFSVNS